MFVHPLADGPAILQIGPIKLSFYSLMYLFAFIIYQTLGEYRLKKTQCFTEDEFDVFFDYSIISILIGGFLGELLFYQLDQIPEIFFNFPKDNFATQSLWLSYSVWFLYYCLSKFYHFPPLSIKFLIIPLLFTLTGGSGMSFHGALIAALITTFFYSWKFNKNGLAILDFITPLVPPGLGLGRFANFVNGELWGRPTQMPWGVIFPRIDFEPRHPSQLYECALEGILLFIILWNFSKTKRPKGSVFGLGLFLYAAFRIFIECFREPSETIGFIAWEWLTMGQLLSLPMLLGGVYLLFRAY